MSRSFSPTFTTASTDRLVSRKYGLQLLAPRRASGRRGRAARPPTARRRRPAALRSSPAADLSSLAWRVAWLSRFSTVSRSARASSISTTRRCSMRVARARSRRRPRTPAARTRWRRPRGCWRGTCCRGPRPSTAPSTSPPMSTTCDRGVHERLRLRHRRQPVDPLVGHLGDADVRDPSWRRRTARRARRHR